MTFVIVALLYRAKLFFRITGLITKRFTGWRFFDSLYAIFGYIEKREQHKYIRIMNEFANQIIEQRREYLIKQQQTIVSTNENGSMSNYADCADYSQRSQKKVFLDVLLQATIDGKPLSNDEIIEETNTFLFAVRDSRCLFSSHVNSN